MRKDSNKRKLTKEEKENLVLLGEIIIMAVGILIATAFFMFFIGSLSK